MGKTSGRSTMRTWTPAAVVALTLTLTMCGTLAWGRGEPRSQDLLDQLDEARINRDLLEIEVEAGKHQLQKMLRVLGETELQAIQGFAEGPVIGGSDHADRAARVDRYKEKLAETRESFVRK